MTPAGLHLTPIGEGRYLLEPGPGLDISQKTQLIEHILGRLQQGGGTLLLYDLGELPLIDDVYYAWLDSLARACKTLNVRMVCVRMQPTAAYALSHRLKAPPVFDTALEVGV